MIVWIKRVLLCDCTVSEYMRNRRITLANCEIIDYDIFILDIAIKHGYESFIRAFRRFHEITPSDARKNYLNLKYSH